MDLIIDQKKLDRTIKNIDLLVKDIERAQERADKIIIQEIIKVLRSEIPIDTGNMRSSVDFNKLFVVIGNRAYVIGHDKDKTRTDDGKHSYGDIVYYGIKKGYYIYPRKAKALRFQVGGETIFAKRVFIPPRAGNRFIDRTVQRLVASKIGEKVYVRELKKVKFIT